jgi:hypothetical protein
MDCPICYTRIKNSCIGSNCTHHFCLDCLKKWKQLGKNTCPICKSNLNEIKLDREFDNLLELIVPIKKGEQNIKKEYIIIKEDLSKYDKIPFKLIVNRKNFLTYTYPGLKVQNINTESNLYKKGMKNGSVIISVNNELCIRAGETIDYLNNCKNKELLVEFKIQKK